MFEIAGGFVLGTIILALFYMPNGFKRDDTDGEKERSGLAIYTDHKTGVQYVGTINGGLTVRVDQDGKPLINKVNN